MSNQNIGAQLDEQIKPVSDVANLRDAVEVALDWATGGSGKSLHMPAGAYLDMLKDVLASVPAEPHRAIEKPAHERCDWKVTNPPQVDATLEQLVREFGNALFECGECQGSPSDYAPLQLKAEEARKKLLAHARKPQPETTLESIADEAARACFNQTRGASSIRPSEAGFASIIQTALRIAISAHARKLQPETVNERLLKAAKLVLAQCSFPSSRSWAAFNEVVSAAESATPTEPSEERVTNKRKSVA